MEYIARRNADARRKIGRNDCPSADESLFVELGGAGQAEQLSHYCCSETTLDGV
jgi:hypothetical protein